MAFRAFVVVYVVGGLTFIPLLILSIFAFAYFTLPRVPQSTRGTSAHPSTKSTADNASDSATDDGFADKDDAPSGNSTDAAGYFAVCREYVPGGVNGKPPERSSPAGEMLNSESPSVYQSMYRSIFDRNKTQATLAEGDKKDSKAIKRPRNVFFVVLRHDHLLLFDNADQLEVRHVVSLLHHDVDIYGGGEVLVEGDLWIKRNCIRLTRRALSGHPGPTSQPFYIFSDNCSEKEDFYHALLLAQSHARKGDGPPSAKQFDTDDIIKLVQTLHKSDADPHTRWINALMGRVFMAMYKTDDIKAAVKAKIDRKISRVPKPNFISSIQVQSVDMGNAAPTFSNPKMKELMVDGSLTIEMDVKYSGGFRLQIAAIARIELGSRIRAREVDLIIAGVLRKLSGHMLIRIKPPPSNRLWITFETPPQMDIAVEPVVSSMQITYSVILRAIESRIREVVSETLVLPNWDDMPFFNTEGQAYRGGIWDEPLKDKKDLVVRDPASEMVPREAGDGRSPKSMTSSNDMDLDDISQIPPLSSKTMSMPSLVQSPKTDLAPKKTMRKPVSVAESEGISTSMSTSSNASATPRSKTSSPRAAPTDKPKAMRSNSFASAASPLVSMDDLPSPHKPTGTKTKGQRDAVDFVKEVKSRSDSMPVQTRTSPKLSRKSSLEEEVFTSDMKRSTSESVAQDAEGKSSDPIPIGQAQSATSQHPDAAARARTWNLSTSPPGGSALERATMTAKSWGMSMMSRHSLASKKSVSGFTSLAKEAGLEDSSGPQQGTAQDPDSIAEDLAKDEETQDSEDLTSGKAGLGKGKEIETEREKSTERSKQPMGRGHPLPPAGTPLPRPEARASLWSASSLNIGSLKRKPVNDGASASLAEHDKVSAEIKDGTRREGDIVAHHHRRTSSALSAGSPQLSSTGTDDGKVVNRRRSSAALSTSQAQARRSRGRSRSSESRQAAEEMLVVAAPMEDDEEVPGQDQAGYQMHAQAQATTDAEKDKVHEEFSDRDEGDEERDSDEVPPALPTRPPPLPSRRRASPNVSPRRHEAEGQQAEHYVPEWTTATSEHHDPNDAGQEEEVGTIDTGTEDAPVAVPREEEVKIKVSAHDSGRTGGANTSGKKKGGWYTGATIGNAAAAAAAAGQAARSRGIGMGITSGKAKSSETGKEKGRGKEKGD